MVRVITTRTNPAAAALAWNASSGLETQLNIWIGITVKGAISHSKDRKGRSSLKGDGGKNAINVSAPIVMIGAVSPIARARPMITPVRIPAAEYGNKWSDTVCHLVAPSA